MLRQSLSFGGAFQKMAQGEGHEVGKSLSGQKAMRSSGPIQTLKDAAKHVFPDAYAGYLRWQYEKVPLSTRIAPILASHAAPSYYDEQFEQLQSAYKKWWEDYGYDRYST